MTDTIQTQAFQRIQADPVLYKAWCAALTYETRTEMLVEQAYELGYAAALRKIQASSGR